MRCLDCLLIYTFSCTLALTAAEPSTSSRPTPRKPFVSKSGGSALKPLPGNQPASVNATPANTAVIQTKSGQAEILTITRSHKAPTVRQAVDQSTSIVPTEEATARFGTGTDAQVGRIIDRK